MIDISEIREKRYEEARKLWHDDFMETSPYRKSFPIVNRESLKIFELENEYKEAVNATQGLESYAEGEVKKLEERAASYTKTVSQLEKELEVYNQRKVQLKTSIEREMKSDSKTFKKAETTLDERIQQANQTLTELRAQVDAMEKQVKLRNPKAQELLEQLRSLLAAQGKELLFLEHQNK